MEFCSKCGGVMIPEKRKSSVVFVCKNCGYTKKATKKAKLITTTKKQKSRRSKEIAVTSPEEVKTREEEKLLLEELYKDSLEYFESG